MSTRPRSCGNENATPEKFNCVSWLVLTGLTALAVVMRFYRLGDFPAGLRSLEDSDLAETGLPFCE